MIARGRSSEAYNVWSPICPAQIILTLLFVYFTASDVDFCTNKTNKQIPLHAVLGGTVTRSIDDVFDALSITDLVPFKHLFIKKTLFCTRRQTS